VVERARGAADVRLNRPTPEGPGQVQHVDRSSDDRQPTSPSSRDLYILAVGVLLGLLLGPAVLGRLHAPTYQRLFVGHDRALQAQLDDATATYLDNRERLKAIDVTPVEIDALDDRHVQQVEPIVADIAAARLRHADGLMQLLGAMVIAVLAVMVLEAVVPSAKQAGLTTARYAILAMWAAIALAQPGLFARVPLLFTALLLAVAVAAAMVPLRRRA
jgi:hypothetical protein